VIIIGLLLQKTKRKRINECTGYCIVLLKQIMGLRKKYTLLQRFEGSPEFEWVNELGPLLNDKFNLKSQEKKVMSLESNIDYEGYNYITPIFNAIINKTVLKLKYEPFHECQT